MLHLLNCAGYLKKVVSDSTLDYSAMHVVSQLLHESLREPRQHLSEVLVSVQALSDMVALKSGLGMSEIWKALSAPNVSDADMTKLLQLDNAAVALPRDMQGKKSHVASRFKKLMPYQIHGLGYFSSWPCPLCL